MMPWTSAQVLSVDNMSKPSIQCGTDENSPVNITYPGTGEKIHLMYPVDHYFQCSSLELSNFDHVIYNVKHRDCGMVFDKQRGTWSVDILLQKQLIITGLEPIFRLTCAYKPLASGSQETNVTFTYNKTAEHQDPTDENKVIIDPVGVKLLVKETLLGILKSSHVMKLQVLDVNYKPTSNIYTGKSLILSLDFHSVIASLYNPPVVTNCFVSDNTNRPKVSFQDQFLTNGCITRSGQQGFVGDDVIKNSSYRSYTQELVVPSAWTKKDKVFFVCYVVVCQKELSCGNMCPIDMSQFEQQPDKMIRAEIKSPMLLTAMDDEFQTQLVAGSWLTINWPYLVIVGVLILVLLIFACIIALVLRESAHCKRCHTYHNLQTYQNCKSHRRSRSRTVSNSTPGAVSRPDSRQSAFSRGDSGIGETLGLHTRRENIRTTPVGSPECRPNPGGPFPETMMHSVQNSGGTKPTGPFAQRIPVYARIPIAVPPRRSISQELVGNKNNMQNKQLTSHPPSTGRVNSEITPAPLLSTRRVSLESRNASTGLGFRPPGINVPAATPLSLDGVSSRPVGTESDRLPANLVTQLEQVVSDISGRYYIKSSRATITDADTPDPGP
ncbi:uncharacterized protein LOC121388032 isoform X2 [Gigantopelta aegis]|nr:uncharacterized protein LOC121388032 isoform X2 [Gigantopelta aegis]